MLPHIMNDVRISAALINCFYDLPKSDSNDDIVIVEEMLKKPYKKNDLIKYLKMKNIKASYIKLNANNLNDFPRIELQSIKTYITFGWYQLKQGLGYLAEHFE
jgi:hypothetical protein